VAWLNHRELPIFNLPISSAPSSPEMQTTQVTHVLFTAQPHLESPQPSKACHFIKNFNNSTLSRIINRHPKRTVVTLLQLSLRHELGFIPSPLVIDPHPPLSNSPLPLQDLSHRPSNAPHPPQNFNLPTSTSRISHITKSLEEHARDFLVSKSINFSMYNLINLIAPSQAPF
jgi:hypothetical protein